MHAAKDWLLGREAHCSAKNGLLFGTPAIENDIFLEKWRKIAANIVESEGGNDESRAFHIFSWGSKGRSECNRAFQAMLIYCKKNPNLSIDQAS
jgi:hypothetical protein